MSLDVSPIRHRDPGEPGALSFAQEGLWYLSQLNPASSAYNVAYRVRLDGELDVEKLQAAIHAVVRRQASLRTVFVAAKGRPLPFALKKSRADLRLCDLRRLAKAERETQASSLTREEAVRPFDLTRDSMLRVVLLRLEDYQHILVHVAPHIVFEGGSVDILYRELSAYYNGAELPELTFDFADFAVWQRENLRGPRLEKLSGFWKNQLNGAPPVDLPTDFPRPSVHTLHGARHYFSPPPDLLRASVEFFRSARTTAYRGLFAVFNVLVYSWTGLTDLCVGSPFAPVNPRCPDLEHVIGYFVNTVALRTQFKPQTTFRELLKIVDRVLWEAITNSDLTFGKVVEAVQPVRDPSRTTLVQVNFRAPKQPNPKLALNGIESGRAEYVDTQSAKFDLALEVESSTGEGSYFEYCTDLFREETIVRMKQSWQSLLEILILNPDRALCEVARMAGAPLP